MIQRCPELPRRYPGTQGADSARGDGTLVKGAIPLLTAVAVLAALLVVAPAPGRADGAAIKWLCPQQNWQIKELHDADPMGANRDHRGCRGGAPAGRTRR